MVKLQPGVYDESIAAEVGEILMSVSNISRICKLAQEQILNDRIEDVITAYDYSPDSM